MAIAEVKYRIEEHQGRNVIIIEDFDTARGSEMKLIHDLLLAIAKKSLIDPQDYMIIYKDSTGRFDGYDFKNREFVALGCLSWKPAVTVYVARQMVAYATEEIPYPNGSTLP